MTVYDDDCDWCEEVLQPYLDRDLTEAERLKAEQHLKGCPYCERRYRFEEGLRRLVRQSVVEPMAPELKQRLSELRLEL
jgi:anti-sigma factor (TIGR02949 family)